MPLRCVNYYSADAFAPSISTSSSCSCVPRSSTRQLHCQKNVTSFGQSSVDLLHLDQSCDAATQALQMTQIVILCAPQTFHFGQRRGLNLTKCSHEGCYETSSALCSTLKGHQHDFEPFGGLMGACRQKNGSISNGADRRGNEHWQMNDLSRESQSHPVFEICSAVHYSGQSEGSIWLFAT